MTDARGDQPRMIRDPKALRALAHPARLEILDHLSSTGATVTATECAELVGLSPSATSYHLRELAKFGMVEEAPSRGDGRERLWRSSVSTWGVDVAQDAQGEAREAEDALLDVYLAWDFARLRGFLAQVRREPKEWHEASVYAGSTLLITAEELVALDRRIRDLIEPLKHRTRSADPPPGARRVRFHLAAFPSD